MSNKDIDIIKKGTLELFDSFDADDFNDVFDTAINLMITTSGFFDPISHLVYNRLNYAPIKENIVYDLLNFKNNNYEYFKEVDHTPICYNMIGYPLHDLYIRKYLNLTQLDVELYNPATRLILVLKFIEEMNECEISAINNFNQLAYSIINAKLLHIYYKYRSISNFENLHKKCLSDKKDGIYYYCNGLYEIDENNLETFLLGKLVTYKANYIEEYNLIENKSIDRPFKYYKNEVTDEVIKVSYHDCEIGKLYSNFIVNNPIQVNDTFAYLEENYNNFIKYIDENRKLLNANRHHKFLFEYYNFIITNKNIKRRSFVSVYDDIITRQHALENDNIRSALTKREKIVYDVIGRRKEKDLKISNLIPLMQEGGHKYLWYVLLKPLATTPVYKREWKFIDVHEMVEFLGNKSFELLDIFNKNSADELNRLIATYSNYTGMDFGYSINMANTWNPNLGTDKNDGSDYKDYIWAILKDSSDLKKIRIKIPHNIHETVKRKGYDNKYFYYFAQHYTNYLYNLYELEYLHSKGIIFERKWKSEYELFLKIRDSFKEEFVLFQESPPFLNGQVYDIYLPYIKIAVEYQGEQHYKPVEIFGGEKGFQDTLKRDNKKMISSKINGVTIIYHKFDSQIEHTLKIINDIVQDKASK